jgi:hypothetical protein
MEIHVIPLRMSYPQNRYPLLLDMLYQVPRGLARRVGAAASGSSGQGWRG